MNLCHWLSNIINYMEKNELSPAGFIQQLLNSKEPLHRSVDNIEYLGEYHKHVIASSKSGLPRRHMTGYHRYPDYHMHQHVYHTMLPHVKSPD